MDVIRNKIVKKKNITHLIIPKTKVLTVHKHQIQIIKQILSSVFHVS